MYPLFCKGQEVEERNIFFSLRSQMQKEEGEFVFKFNFREAAKKNYGRTIKRERKNL